MIKCSEIFKQTMADTYRDQGYLDFDIIEDVGKPMGVVLRDSAYQNEIVFSPATGNPLFDKNIKGDHIATLERGRWLLDGSMHSLYPNNVATGVYSESVDANDLGQHSYEEHNVVTKRMCGSDKAFMLTKDPVISLSFKQDNWPVTDHITLIWDPILQQFPINYEIHYRYYYAHKYAANPTGQGRKILGGVIKGATQFDGYTYIHTFKIPQGKVVIVDIDIRSVDTNTIITWSSPNARLRLAEVILGDYYSSDNADINLTSATVTKEVSPLNNSKPAYNADLVFDNTLKVFDPLKRKGIITKLNKNMIIPLRWGIKPLDAEPSYILYTEVVYWYIDSWECLSNSNEFKLKLKACPDEFLDSIYYPTSFIYHTSDDPAKDTKRTPGKYYTICSWLSDIITSVGAKKYAKIDKLNPFALNSTNGWPLLENVYTLLQKFSQCIDSYLKIDTEIGKLTFSTIPVFNQSSRRVIKESEIIESPLIQENTTIVKELSYNLYKLTLTDKTAQVTKNVDAFSGGTTLSLPFGTINLEGNSCNVLGLPENYYYDPVNIVKDFTYYGREAIFTVNNVSVSSTIGSTISNLTAEDVINYIYKLNNYAEGNVLTIDNNFVTDAYIIYTLMQSLGPIINSANSISIKTIGEVDIEPGDYIYVETEYGNFNVFVLKTTINFNGGFTGTIEGIIINYAMDN